MSKGKQKKASADELHFHRAQDVVSRLDADSLARRESLREYAAFLRALEALVRERAECTEMEAASNE